MSDYMEHQETLKIDDSRNAIYCTFAFNELLAVLDDASQDTGLRAHFVGLEIDEMGDLTGRANVSIVNGPTRMIPLKNLSQVKH